MSDDDEPCIANHVEARGLRREEERASCLQTPGEMVSRQGDLALAEQMLSARPTASTGRSSVAWTNGTSCAAEHMGGLRAVESKR